MTKTVSSVQNLKSGRVPSVEELEFRALRARRLLKEAGQVMLSHGWNGKLLTRKERAKIADEYVKEKGWSLD